MKVGDLVKATYNNATGLSSQVIPAAAHNKIGLIVGESLKRHGQPEFSEWWVLIGDEHWSIYECDLEIISESR